MSFITQKKLINIFIFKNILNFLFISKIINNWRIPIKYKKLFFILLLNKNYFLFNLLI